MPIHRLQFGRTNGFQVRVGPRSKLFSIRKLGGESQALRLAKQYERALKIEHPSPSMRGRPGPRANVSKINTSGLVGLRAVHVNYSDFGVPTLCIQASWSKKGHAGSTNISTTKHGVLEAVRLAILARERGAGMIVGLTPRQAWLILKRGVSQIQG